MKLVLHLTRFTNASNLREWSMILDNVDFIHSNVGRWDSSVDPITLLAEYAVFPLTSWKLKGSRSCWRLKGNKKKRKLDGMESSKSKSDAHFMHG